MRCESSYNAGKVMGLLSSLEMSCLLAPMLYQACYTSNTSGVFKGFHNGWGGQTKTALYRILSQFQLKPAIFYDNSLENTVYKMDCVQLAKKLSQEGEVADIAYLDPPYNQHPYGSNYHVLNTITLWDQPTLTEKIEGRNKAAIREDWRTQRRSPYNHRSEAAKSYAELLCSLKAKYILTSYSTDGMIPLPALVEACIQKGQTDFVLQKYKRYRVSSQRFSSQTLKCRTNSHYQHGKISYRVKRQKPFVIAFCIRNSLRLVATQKMPPIAPSPCPSRHGSSPAHERGRADAGRNSCGLAACPAVLVSLSVCLPCPVILPFPPDSLPFAAALVQGYTTSGMRWFPGLDGLRFTSPSRFSPTAAGTRPTTMCRCFALLCWRRWRRSCGHFWIGGVPTTRGWMNG